MGDWPEEGVCHSTQLGETFYFCVELANMRSYKPVSLLVELFNESRFSMLQKALNYSALLMLECIL